MKTRPYESSRQNQLQKTLFYAAQIQEYANGYSKFENIVTVPISGCGGPQNNLKQTDATTMSASGTTSKGSSSTQNKSRLKDVPQFFICRIITRLKPRSVTRSVGAQRNFFLRIVNSDTNFNRRVSEKAWGRRLLKQARNRQHRDLAFPQYGTFLSLNKTLLNTLSEYSTRNVSGDQKTPSDRKSVV